MGSKTRKVAALVFVISAAGIFFFANTCLAEKTAYVDLAMVFDGYEKAKDFDIKLDGARKTEQEKIDKKIEEIRSLQDKLPLLSEEEKKNKQGEVEQLARGLQEYQRNAETSLIKERNEKLQKVLKDIQQVVEEIAKKNGYDLVVTERMVLYVNDNINITDAVVKELNEKYKKG